jgi:hypothetical protein
MHTAKKLKKKKKENKFPVEVTRDSQQQQQEHDTAANRRLSDTHTSSNPLRVLLGKFTKPRLYFEHARWTFRVNPIFFKHEHHDPIIVTLEKRSNQSAKADPK